MKHIKIYDYEKKIETVMVNNSTNINKTNNHLLPQVIEHQKNPTYSIGNLCHGLYLLYSYIQPTCLID